MRNNKQGTTMVEAAIIFPLVIAAVFTVIYIMINLYSHTTLQSSLHIELRGAEGLETGLTSRTLSDGAERDKYRAANENIATNENIRVVIEANNQIIRPYVFTAPGKNYHGISLFNSSVGRQYLFRYYLVNDVDIFLSDLYK